MLIDVVLCDFAQVAGDKLFISGANIDRIRADATDLANAKPDLIMVYSVRVLNAARQVTGHIPVVFIATSDPVGLGLVDSLARPGGNLTGFMVYEVFARRKTCRNPQGDGTTGRESGSRLQPGEPQRRGISTIDRGRRKNPRYSRCLACGARC